MKRIFTFILVTRCVWSPSPVKCAEPVYEIRKARKLNMAEVRLLSAQRSLEELNLEQYEALLKRGHASWLEVARQRSRVKTLQQQHQASIALGDRLQRFELRFAQHSFDRQDGQGSDETAEHEFPTTPPIEQRAPGAMRLVAWLYPEDLSTESLAQYRALLREQLASFAIDQRNESARRTVVDQQAVVDVLAGLKVTEKNRLDLIRAQRELEVAQARYQLIQINSRRCDELADRIASVEKCLALRQRQLSDAPITEPPTRQVSITHLTSSTLRRATLHLADRETESDSERRAANLALKRHRIQLQRLLQLREMGAATQLEVSAARETLREAESVVERLQQDRRDLFDLRQKLRQIDPTFAGSLEAHKLDDPLWNAMTFPVCYLSRGEVIKYLVRLWRESTDTEMRRQAILAEREFLQAWRSRLDAASPANHLDLKKRSVTSGHQADREERSPDFPTLRRRERDDLEERLELSSWQLRAVQDRLALGRLEEHRFLLQVQSQHEVAAFRRQNDGTTSVATATKYVSALNLQSRVDRFPSYVEWTRPLVLPTWDSELAMGMRVGRASDVAFAHEQYVRSRRFRRSTASLVTPTRQRACWVVGHLTFDFSGLGSGRTVHLRRLTRDAFSSRIRSYSDYYAFGIRRADLCAPKSRFGRATPYGGPWYLPGSPTNFK